MAIKTQRDTKTMLKRVLNWNQRTEAEKVAFRRFYHLLRAIYSRVADKDALRLEAWHNTLLSFADGTAPAGLALPAFPSEELQTQWVGSSFKRALQEPYRFYDLVRRYSTSLGTPLRDPSARFLDFGCGWGRFLRYAMLDFQKERLFAVDIDPDIIGVCHATGVPATFSVITPNGKLPYEDNSFSHVIAYSVFTHLPELLHKRWVAEIERVMRPGGIFVATLESRRFLSSVASLAKEENIKSGWDRALARFSAYTNDYLSAYDRGEFVYLPTGGGGVRTDDVYGDAFVPVSFVEANWSNLNIKAHIDDGTSQDVVVAQKSRRRARA